MASPIIFTAVRFSVIKQCPAFIRSNFEAAMDKDELSKISSLVPTIKKLNAL